MLEEYIRSQVKRSLEVKTAILEHKDLMGLIGTVAAKAVETYRNGNKLLLAGNGGSAADAQHLAGELVSRFYFDRPGLPAVALTTDTSILTAIGNDYEWVAGTPHGVPATVVAGQVEV